ncbi:hypothetical protein AeNC1_012875 [Aphanomyces euteiches]|nr:hypothetical protein AeNC1_012875 [Aphanomyces euteiches]
MAARQARSAAKTWFSDPATYPIIGIMALAGFVGTFAGVRFVTTSPDVLISKEKRTKFYDRSNEDIDSFRSHRISVATMQSNPITREANYQEFKARSHN